MRKVVSILISCLLVVSFFPKTAQAASVLSTDSYYINEKSGGKYLWSSGTATGAKQGKLSTLGTSIQWKVTNKDSTWSTVSLASNSTKYLCNESGSAVSLKTVSGTIPDSCLWSFTMESGGIRIKNKATGNYLYVSGGNIAAVSLTANPSYWRTISVSKYGTTSAYTYREFSGLTMSAPTVKLGDTDAISFSKFPANANILWAGVDDFTYTITENSGNCSVPSAGKIKGLNLGTATLKMVHKPTGLTFTKTVTIMVDAALFGVPAAGHDHSSALQTAKATLTSAGLDNIWIKTSGTISMDNVKTGLQYSSLFISRSHGDYTTDGTYIVIGNASSEIKFYGSELYDWSAEKPWVVLSRCKICMFVGCYTGKVRNPNHNLPESAVGAGAKAAVGFQKSITCSKANTFTEEVVENLVAGQGIYTALQNAVRDLDQFGSYGLASCKVSGNQSQTLK